MNGGGSGPSASGSGGHDGGGDEHLFSGSGRSSDDSDGNGSGDSEPCSPDSDAVSAFLSSMDWDCRVTVIAGVYGADFRLDLSSNQEQVCGCVVQASVDSMPDCEVDGVVYDADLHHHCELVLGVTGGQGSDSSISSGDIDDTYSGDLEPWCGGSDAALWFISGVDRDCKTVFFGDNFATTPEQVCGCVVQASADEMPDCEDDGVVFDADLHHECTLMLATAAPTLNPTLAPKTEAPAPPTTRAPTGVWTRAPTAFILDIGGGDFGGLPSRGDPSTSDAQKDEDATGGAFVVFIVLLVAASVFLSTAVAVRKYREKDVGSAADADSESTTKPIPLNTAYDTPLLYKADDAAGPVYSSADPACGEGNAAAAEPVYNVGDARASVGYDIVDARGSVVYDIGDARGSVVYDIGDPRGSIVYDIGDARGSVVYDIGSSENAIPEEDGEDDEDGVPVSRLNPKTDPVRPAIPEEDVEAGVPVSRMRTTTSVSSAITDWGDDEAAGQAYENHLTDETDEFQDTDGLPLRGQTVRVRTDSLSDDGNDNGPVQPRNTEGTRRESMV